MRRRQDSLASSASSFSVEEEEPHSSNCGDVPLPELMSDSQADAGNWSRSVASMDWTAVGALTPELKDKEVLIRRQAQTTRPMGKNMAFLVVREEVFTVQCLAAPQSAGVSRRMLKFVAGLNRGTIIDVIGVVSVPRNPIKGTTQQVEIQVRKLYCVTKAMPNLPIIIKDAVRSDVEIANALQIFRQFLLSEGFVEICTPKLTAGSSEGGSAVFKLDYFGQPACLARSPQLHKQMAICSEQRRVFEIGPVFRAEHSYTHRHLCEFTGLDVEMRIKKHYAEVMDLVDRLFVTIFDSLNERCEKELEAVGRQYPFEPLKYKPKTLRLTFERGVQMLKDAGMEVDPLGDLNTDAERKLGQLVLEKYGTEFYILHRYPLAVRPFYSMPCFDNSLYSKSFDVFIRGEEIISGAQRIHVPEMLEEGAQACGIDVNTISISTYFDSIRYGPAGPHGGFGAGLERIVMLFCGLDNIRKTPLFPRDPRRLAPLKMF
ncbi:hypothetical protein QUC31_015839 [Theobroma cacao]